MGSKFSFLKSNYPELFTISELSERLLEIDSNSSLAKSRLFSEKIALLIWDFEDLEDFNGNLAERINQLFYKNCIPEIVKDILHTIRKSGNKAAHDGNSNRHEALFILKKCFSLAKWFYETYENDYLGNIEYVLPIQEEAIDVKALQQQLETLSKQVYDYKQKIESLNSSPEVVENRKQRGFSNANNIHLDESDTRITLIDKQLAEAGWECDTTSINYKKNKTLPEKGKNKAIAEWPCNGKWADYALFVGTELYELWKLKNMLLIFQLIYINLKFMLNLLNQTIFLLF